jgi:hypothetical protein
MPPAAVIPTRPIGGTGVRNWRDVFVSHSNADRDFVSTLYRSLSLNVPRTSALNRVIAESTEAVGSIGLASTP